MQAAAKQQKLNAADKSPVLQRLTAGTMTGTDTANLKKALKAAEANYNKHGIVVKGIFKDLLTSVNADFGFNLDTVPM